MNEKELELKTIEANVVKYDTQLNTIKKNDEFAAVKGNAGLIVQETKDVGGVLSCKLKGVPKWIVELVNTDR